MTKKCRKCGNRKERTAFPARPDSPDGRHGWCTACHVARQQERREAERAAFEDEEYQRKFREKSERVLREHERPGTPRPGASDGKNGRVPMSPRAG